MIKRCPGKGQNIHFGHRAKLCFTCTKPSLYLFAVPNWKLQSIDLYTMINMYKLLKKTSTITTRQAPHFTYLLYQIWKYLLQDLCTMIKRFQSLTKKFHNNHILAFLFYRHQVPIEPIHCTKFTKESVMASMYYNKKNLKIRLKSSIIAILESSQNLFYVHLASRHFSKITPDGCVEGSTDRWLDIAHFIKNPYSGGWLEYSIQWLWKWFFKCRN